MDRAFIIYELVKSAQVAGHLLRNMKDDHMGKFICKAPVTVWWKCDLLREFGFPQYAEIREAAQHSLKENKQFTLRSFLSAWELCFTLPPR